MTRQKDGRETWSRILKWDKGQTPSERLSALILISEDFKSIDPSHPLGGKDGLKDILCKNEGKKLIAAAYFPRDQQSFKTTKDKFLEDAEGIKKNKAEGIVFVTNQELRLAERDELKDSIENKEVIIYHLERIASILNSPKNYGIRLEFLDIEMTKEEQLAYMASKDIIIHDLSNLVKQLVAKSDETNEVQKDKMASAIEVWPEHITGFNKYSLGYGKPYHKCSYCGYGYKIAGSRSDYYSGSYADTAATMVSGSLLTGSSSDAKIITCPKCGNTEEYYRL